MLTPMVQANMTSSKTDFAVAGISKTIVGGASARLIKTARTTNPAVKANTNGKTLLRWVWRYGVAMIY